MINEPIRPKLPHVKNNTIKLNIKNKPFITFVLTLIYWYIERVVEDKWINTKIYNLEIIILYHNNY